MKRRTDGLLLECMCCHRMKPRGQFRNRGARGEMGAWPSKRSWCKSCERPGGLARKALRRARELNAPGGWSGADVAELMYRQRGRCGCGCGQSLIVKGYHVDHWVPLAKGGSNKVDNLKLLTPACNRRKGASLVGARLVTRLVTTENQSCSLKQLSSESALLLS